jgi:hypothetical protein
MNMLDTSPQLIRVCLVAIVGKFQMGNVAKAPMTAEQKTITNPELERAMDAVAKNDNLQTRESLYRAILASTLIVSGGVFGDLPGQDGTGVAGNNTRISFRTVESPSGHVILPTFTNLDALVTFSGSEVPWVALDAQALFQSILPGNIAEVRVNPFRTGQRVSRPGGIITRREFTSLALGFLPELNVAQNVDQLKAVAGQKLTLRQPTEELPAALVKRLAAYFRQIRELERAYFIQMINQNTSSNVVGLQFSRKPDDETMHQFMRGLGDVMRGQLPRGATLDFLPVAGPLLDAARDCGRLIFER